MPQKLLQKFVLFIYLGARQEHTQVGHQTSIQLHKQIPIITHKYQPRNKRASLFCPSIVGGGESLMVQAPEIFQLPLNFLQERKSGKSRPLHFLPRLLNNSYSFVYIVCLSVGMLYKQAWMWLWQVRKSQPLLFLPHLLNNSDRYVFIVCLSVGMLLEHAWVWLWQVRNESRNSISSPGAK